MNIFAMPSAIHMIVTMRLTGTFAKRAREAMIDKVAAERPLELGMKHAITR